MEKKEKVFFQAWFVMISAGWQIDLEMVRRFPSTPTRKRIWRRVFVRCIYFFLQLDSLMAGYGFFSRRRGEPRRKVLPCLQCIGAGRRWWHLFRLFFCCNMTSARDGSLYHQRLEWNTLCVSGERKFRWLKAWWNIFSQLRQRPCQDACGQIPRSRVVGLLILPP